MFENPQNLPEYEPVSFDFRWRYLMRKAGLERKQDAWRGHVSYLCDLGNDQRKVRVRRGMYCIAHQLRKI